MEFCLLQKSEYETARHGFEMIFEALKLSCSTLRQIKITHCYLNAKRAEYLRDILYHCSSLEAIDLSSSRSIGNRYQTIFEGLKSSCNTLKEISTAECKLCYERANSLGEMLEQCSSLKSINLSLNNEMKDGFKMICEGLRSSGKTLKQINLAGCCLDAQQACYLGETLHYCSSLESIILSSSGMMGNGFKVICKGLQSSCKTLKCIEVNKCALNTEQAYYLGETFQYCTILETIDISFNNKMENGFKMICKGLQSSCNTLKQINVTKCLLDYEQANYLGEMFQQCSSLEIIDLFFNRLLKNGFNKIFKGIQSSCKSLKHIYVSGCLSDSEQANALGEMLQHCSSLEAIGLSWNREMENGFKNVCEGLKSSGKTLKHIDTVECHLDEEQAKYLGETLHHCSSLESISLSGNSNMGNGFKIICKGLQSSRNTLKQLDISNCSLNDKQATHVEEMFKYCSRYVEIYRDNKLFKVTISN